MGWIANLLYWVLAASGVTGLVAIALLWERMRRHLNLALPATQRVSIYPAPPKSFREIFKAPNLGHFVDVLDQYEHIYPYSPLPKKVAFGAVIWILGFMALLASGIGR
jgi:hypothetical protein